MLHTGSNPTALAWRRMLAGGRAVNTEADPGPARPEPGTVVNPGVGVTDSTADRPACPGQ